MRKARIHFVNEGDEEEAFLEILRAQVDSGVFALTSHNAHGAGNIPLFVDSALGSGQFDVVFAVYDVDGKGNEEGSTFSKARKGLARILGSQELVDSLSLWTNPNILQMILLACRPLSEVGLHTTVKKENSAIVNRCFPSIGKTDKSFYDAQKWQLDVIRYSFDGNPYRFEDIVANSKGLSDDFRLIPSSNWPKVIKRLLNNDVGYFSELARKLAGS